MTRPEHAAPSTPKPRRTIASGSVLDRSNRVLADVVGQPTVARRRTVPGQPRRRPRRPARVGDLVGSSDPMVVAGFPSIGELIDPAAAWDTANTSGPRACSSARSRSPTSDPPSPRPRPPSPTRSGGTGSRRRASREAPTHRSNSSAPRCDRLAYERDPVHKQSGLTDLSGRCIMHSWHVHGVRHRYRSAVLRHDSRCWTRQWPVSPSAALLRRRRPRSLLALVSRGGRSCTTSRRGPR